MDGQAVDQTDSQRFGGLFGFFCKIACCDNPCIVATIDLLSGLKSQNSVVADICRIAAYTELASDVELIEWGIQKLVLFRDTFSKYL